MTLLRTAKVGRLWFLLFTLAWLAIWTVQLTPVQLLLPDQLDTPGAANTWVSGVVYSGIVLGVGGLAGIVAGPLSGSLSDRTRSRWGRRRPWAMGASWLTAVCLVLTGLAQGPWVIGLAWTGVSIGVAVASAAFTALIADQLPESQRGAASASASSSQAVGIVVGVGAVVLLGLSVVAGYVALAGFIAMIGTLTAALLPDPRPDAAQQPVRERRGLPWESLRDRDFAWVVWGRFVTNVGNALPTTLFLFFLMYGLGQPKAQAEDSLLLIIVVYTVFVVIASVLAGWWSDRTGARRGLTVISALVQAAAAIVIIVAPSQTTTMIAAAVLGVGYGAFSTVGLAFATDLLPHPDDHARDLGLVNTSAALGQLVGPLIGALLVALVGGFWLLLVASLVLSAVGGVMSGFARDRRSAASRQQDPAPH
ncbi:MFS transporter [Microbacterium protaetiae]|uniref:MFS transporter n=1 Tax=Microbacterium protaetiae TaxID=2509458 RepID=A0A4P6EM98_9MICO|nr:MFS transporter [Microbacterium protaetiae]QAY61367.1 MFS transporter [Microbacterium protaetiae]